MKNLLLPLLFLIGLTSCSKSKDIVDPNNRTNTYSGVSSITFATAGTYNNSYKENTTFTINKTQDSTRLLFTDKVGYSTGGTKYATLTGSTFIFDRGRDSIDSTYFETGYGSFSGDTVTFRIMGYSSKTTISRDKIEIAIRHTN